MTSEWFAESGVLGPIIGVDRGISALLSIARPGQSILSLQAAAVSLHTTNSLKSRSRERALDRDQRHMIDDDMPEATRLATAANVLQCLTMLAEEAENLNLPRTMLALRKAIRACQAEQTRPTPAAIRPRRHLVLH
jgi:hypothetical protein